MKILIKVEIIIQIIILLIIKEEKIKLNTVIVKRENNPNFIGNKDFFMKYKSNLKINSIF